MQMVQPQIVEVMKDGGYNDTPTTIAYIHLIPGQSVREIHDSPSWDTIGEFRQLGGKQDEGTPPPQ